MDANGTVTVREAGFYRINLWMRYSPDSNYPTHWILHNGQVFRPWYHEYSEQHAAQFHYVWFFEVGDEIEFVGRSHGTLFRAGTHLGRMQIEYLGQ